MTRINEASLLALGGGVLSLYYAVGKRPPEWLAIASAVSTVVGMTAALQDLVIDDNMAGLNQCKCEVQNGRINQKPSR